jgi:ribosomal protein S18 acetylase RimI-like enzyme
MTPAPPVPWTAFPDLAPIAALLERDVAELGEHLAMLPSGLDPVALAGADGPPVAAGLYVTSNLAATGRCALAWLSARQPAAAMALVEAVEERARADGAAGLDVSERRAGGVAPLLAARGYARVNAMVRMRRTRRRPVPALPPGHREAALEEVGSAAWAWVDRESFRDVAFTIPLSEEDAERQRAVPGFDADLLRFVLDEEGPVAYLRGLLSRDGSGEVESIGVLARGRRRGLGRWVLRRCEALLDARGATEVVLRVAESNGPALALYRTEGYEEAGRDAAWHRPLSSRAASP